MQIFNQIFSFLFCCIFFAAKCTSVLTCLLYYKVGIFAWQKYQVCNVHSRSRMTGTKLRHFWCLVFIYFLSSGKNLLCSFLVLLHSDVQSDFSIFRLKPGETAKCLPTHTHTCTVHVFINLDAYKRNLGKWLCTFMENVWLLEPALEMLLLAILRTQEYTRPCGRCLATDGHKYAKETMTICNINEVHLPP